MSVKNRLKALRKNVTVKTNDFLVEAEKINATCVALHALLFELEEMKPRLSYMHAKFEIEIEHAQTEEEVEAECEKWSTMRVIYPK